MKRILKLSLNNEKFDEEERQYHLLMEKHQIISRNTEAEIAAMAAQIDSLVIKEQSLLEEISTMSLNIENEKRIRDMKSECNAIYEELQRKASFKMLKECLSIYLFFV